jgi:hypothetical protein
MEDERTIRNPAIDNNSRKSGRTVGIEGNLSFSVCSPPLLVDASLCGDYLSKLSKPESLDGWNKVGVRRSSSMCGYLGTLP